ncbi:Av71 muscle cell intermediate filament [Culex quinquefasciatus]|uniref:Av71 muscle cell intermediate filament n=1 Tax=Culex quinquefasciatus TaxID=7176 RepID=B0WY52_CULQU|nr:Av71 muscle cell intermediate filament [Culex quinquefasciatus]|eukprot:XP_001862324.1 Av71 muscle cell intermediate filament [Culex quinquefasciatus]
MTFEKGCSNLDSKLAYICTPMNPIEMWSKTNLKEVGRAFRDRTGKTEVELKLRQIQALSPRKPPKRHGSVCTQKMKKWKIVQTQTGSTSSSSPVLTLERIILHEVRRVIVVNQGRDHGPAKFSGGIVLGGGGHGCQVEGFVRNFIQPLVLFVVLRWYVGTQPKNDKRVTTTTLLGKCNGSSPQIWVRFEPEVKKQETRNKKQETRNKKQETRNKKQETRNKKQETRNKKQETRNKKQETRSKKQETRNKKQETRNRNKKQETRNKKQETRNKKQETRNKKQETRNNQHVQQHIVVRSQVLICSAPSGSTLTSVAPPTRPRGNSSELHLFGH